MSSQKRILIVDGDAKLRQALVMHFKRCTPYGVGLVAHGSDALEQVKQQRYDLVLIDFPLPDIDGRELFRTIRSQGYTMPIIMLSAAAKDDDIIQGLESGANDYVIKPFRLGILLARMRAQLRQHEQNEDAVFTIGDYSFRPSAKLLSDNASNEKIRLTEKETAILKYLVRSGNRAVPREVLLNEIWGYTTGISAHTVESHIYRMRKKIERDPAKPKLLVTASHGYRLDQ